MAHITALALPLESGVNGTGGTGTIDYLLPSDPVFHSNLNRPLKNLSQRDNLAAVKTEALIVMVDNAFGFNPDGTTTGRTLVSTSEPGQAVPQLTLELMLQQSINANGTLKAASIPGGHAPVTITGLPLTLSGQQIGIQVGVGANDVPPGNDVRFHSNAPNASNTDHDGRYTRISVLAAVTGAALVGFDATGNVFVTGGTVQAALDAADVTFIAIDAILSAATFAATANTLMKRDAAARAQVADPAVAADIATKGYVDTQIAAGSLQSHMNEFRLTGASGTPVPTADIATTTNIYLTPYKGNRITLYFGGAWGFHSSIEVTFALSGLTTGKNYDVFAYWTGAAVALELSAAWTDDTTRADALAFNEGVLVKSVDHTRRYIGTFRTISATETRDTLVERYIYNYYNRVRRKLAKNYNVTITPGASAGWRAANANGTLGTGACVALVLGITEDTVELRGAIPFALATGDDVAVAIGVDSTTVPEDSAAVQYASTTSTSITDTLCPGLSSVPSIGFHQYNLLEKFTSAGTSEFGDSTLLGTIGVGIHGHAIM